MKVFTDVEDKQDYIFAMFSFGEAKILLAAIEEYCNNNRRKRNAKKLKSEMDKKFEVYKI